MARAANKSSTPPSLVRAVKAASRAGGGGRGAAVDCWCTVLQGARPGPDDERAKEQRQIDNENPEERSRPARSCLFAKPPATPAEEHGSKRSRQGRVTGTFDA